MARIDLDDLSLFRHVTEAGSITAGAARVDLALASASTRVRGMEIALGTRLLERSRQGILLTPAGHARALLAQADRLYKDMSIYAGGTGGHVKLLSKTNALTEFLPEALGRFLAAYPSTTVDQRERLSEEIVDLVAEGAADVGIVAGTVDAGVLQTRPFRSDRFVLVTPRTDGLAGMPLIAFAEVLGRNFVGLDQRARSSVSWPAGRRAKAGDCGCAFSSAG